MHKGPKLRPRMIRPMTRDYKPSYFQMHVYDQELQRLDAERSEISKRVNAIEGRVSTLKQELEKLENVLKGKRSSPVFPN